MSDRLEVLFVCTANICRSPAMELMAREMAAQAPGEVVVSFSSAGTHARDGQPMNPPMAQTLPPGLADGFRSRHLTTSMLQAADLVLTAEAVHRQHVLDDHPQLHRTVFTLGQFAAATADEPGTSGRALIEAVAARRRPSAPGHDVADPYRRGAAAALRATGTMSTMLTVIVPRLLGARRHTGEGA